MVQSQGNLIDNIETNINDTNNNLENGVDQLNHAHKKQKRPPNGAFILYYF